MRVLLRCDASAGGGVGHLVRCLAVAEAAAARGWDVLLAGRLDVPLARRLVERAGLTVVAGADDGPALARLARTQDADVVHVDHYGLPDDLLRACRSAGVVLSSAEDGGFGRRPADVVVDATLGAEQGQRPDDGSGEVLRGIAYAPLRTSVRRARDAAAAPAPTGAVPSVLVVLGGTDAAGLTPAVVALCGATGLTLRLTVVAPQAHLDLGALPDRLAVDVVGPQDDLPALAARHTAVVSASGTTVVELACVGAPSALVPVVANQVEGYRRVVDAGLAVGLGTADEVLARDGAAVGTLRRLLTDAALRTRLSRTGRALVDGEGATRLVEAWERALGGADGLRARPATQRDAALLRTWRNDPATRAASRSTDEVSAADHERWLAAVLDDPDRLLLVVEDDGRPVGTVRFDRLAAPPEVARAIGPGTVVPSWEVSITVAPEERGRGRARAVLAAGEAAWRRTVGPEPAVLACVRPDNPASARLFRAAGYRPAPAFATALVDAYVKPSDGDDRPR